MVDEWPLTHTLLLWYKWLLCHFTIITIGYYDPNFPGGNITRVVDKYIGFPSTVFSIEKLYCSAIE